MTIGLIDHHLHAQLARERVESLRRTMQSGRRAPTTQAVPDAPSRATATHPARAACAPELRVRPQA